GRLAGREAETLESNETGRSKYEQTAGIQGAQ
ncbi:hypothetical protein A2U01_0110033, partial [Trifolium medium]|nr:hypothetical protein [Trifolium medium]